MYRSIYLIMYIHKRVQYTGKYAICDMFELCLVDVLDVYVITERSLLGILEDLCFFEPAFIFSCSVVLPVSCCPHFHHPHERYTAPQLFCFAYSS